MRIHDARLGRFLSVDPLEKDYPWNSTYSFAENDPINYIDLDGAEKSKSELQDIEKQNIVRLQVIRADARLGVIAAQGSVDAFVSAKTFGISELFGTKLEDYKLDVEKEAYLRGRIAGDVAAGLASYGQITFGGGFALATGAETMGTGAAVGAAISAHGAVSGIAAGADIAWAFKKLYELNTYTTATVDVTTSTTLQATSANSKQSTTSTNSSSNNQSRSPIGQQLENTSKREPIAQAYEDAATGAASDVSTRKRIVPTLSYKNPNTSPRAADFVRFDAYDANTKTFVDRKFNITTFTKSLNQLKRMAEAIRQNPGYNGVIEVPSLKVYKRAVDALSKAGVTNISARVAN